MKKENVAVYDYMMRFASDKDNAGWSEEKERIRSFFTTWCFMEGICADTVACDAALNELYQTVTEAESMDTDLIPRNEFENFMLKFIV